MINDFSGGQTKSGAEPFPYASENSPDSVRSLEHQLRPEIAFSERVRMINRLAKKVSFPADLYGTTKMSVSFGIEKHVDPKVAEVSAAAATTQFPSAELSLQILGFRLEDVSGRLQIEEEGRVRIADDETIAQKARQYVHEHLVNAIAEMSYRYASDTERVVPLTRDGELTDEFYRELLKAFTTIASKSAWPLLTQLVVALHEYAEGHKISGAWGEVMLTEHQDIAIDASRLIERVALRV